VTWKVTELNRNGGKTVAKQKQSQAQSKKIFFDKALLQFILIPNRIYTKYQLSTWADPMQP
jgi:hypothetical protein